MGRRLGLTCISIYCLQVGVTSTVAAQNVLNMDKYSIIFEYYQNLLASMEAQRFFVQQISFNMAPVVLAIGIVLRSFFFSRKLGGLLMSIAIGVMFFFPGMYIFDWLTLNMTVNGDKPLGTRHQLPLGVPDIRACRAGREGQPDDPSGQYLGRIRFIRRFGREHRRGDHKREPAAGTPPPPLIRAGRNSSTTSSHATLAP